MAAKKQTRKELLKSPDEFLTFYESAIEYIQLHSKQFTTGAIVVLAVIILAIGITSYTKHAAAQAVNAYNLAAAQVPAPSDEFDSAKAGAAIKALEKVIADHSGSAPAHYALLDLGALYYNLGDFDKSYDAYDKFLSGLRKEDENLKPMVLDSLAYTLEARKKYEQAAEKWEQVIALDGDLMKEEAYMGLGRVQQARGKLEESKKAFEELIAGYPNSSYAEQAKAKLAALSK